MKQMFNKYSKVFVVLMLLLSLTGCEVGNAEVTQDMEQDSQGKSDYSGAITEDGVSSDESKVESVDTVEGALQGISLRIGTSGTTAPFSYYDADNTTLIGYDIDLLNALKDLLGFTIKNETLRTMDDATLIDSVKNGDVDLAFSIITTSDENKKSMDFSDSYYSTSQIVVINQEKSPKEITGIDTLEKGNYKVGVVKDTPSESYAKDAITKDNIVSFDNDASAYAAISQGKVDALIKEQQNASSYIKSAVGTKLSIIGEPFNQDKTPYVIAISNDLDKMYPGIVDLINEALTELTENGTLSKIQEKWCP